MIEVLIITAFIVGTLLAIWVFLNGGDDDGEIED